MTPGDVGVEGVRKQPVRRHRDGKEEDTFKKRKERHVLGAESHVQEPCQGTGAKSHSRFSAPRIPLPYLCPPQPRVEFLLPILTPLAGQLVPMGALDSSWPHRPIRAVQRGGPVQTHL